MIREVDWILCYHSNPKEICAPVRLCTSCHDGILLFSLSNFSSRQLLWNHRDWFYARLDQRFLEMPAIVRIGMKNRTVHAWIKSKLKLKMLSKTSSPTFQGRKTRGRTPRWKNNINNKYKYILFIIYYLYSGEEDEGAHPHDGIELEDGKGFVAVGRASWLINKNWSGKRKNFDIFLPRLAARESPRWSQRGLTQRGTRWTWSWSWRGWSCVHVPLKVWSVHKGNHLSCGQAVLQIGDKLIVGGGLGRVSSLV